MSEQKMILQKVSLARHMTLYAIPTDRFKTGMLSISMAMECRETFSPLTSLLFLVLRRGTKSYPTLAKLNERLDFLYASSLSVRNFRLGGAQVTGFCTEFLDSRYLGGQAECDMADGCLALMSELLFSPCLDDEKMFLDKYVESEKQNLKDMILSRHNQPSAYAAVRLGEIMHAGEPCGISLYGDAERISGFSREQLHRTWQTWQNNVPFDFFYVGPEAPERVAERIMRYFGDHVPSDARRYVQHPVIRVADRVKRVTEDRDVCQGKLNIGYRAGCTLHDPDFYAMVMANELLGNSPMSKLFMNVREKESLCYAIGSTYDLYQGTVRISCGISPDQYDAALEAIETQWEEIRRGNFTRDEWQAAVQSLDNSYRTIADSPLALESFYYGRILAGVDMTVDDCRRAFATVTPQEVMAAAKKVSLDTVYFLHGTKEGEEETDDFENET